jgi:hypothetical protein
MGMIAAPAPGTAERQLGCLGCHGAATTPGRRAPDDSISSKKDPQIARITMILAGNDARLLLSEIHAG